VHRRGNAELTKKVVSLMTREDGGLLGREALSQPGLEGRRSSANSRGGGATHKDAVDLVDKVLEKGEITDREESRHDVLVGSTRKTEQRMWRQGKKAQDGIEAPSSSFPEWASLSSISHSRRKNPMITHEPIPVWVYLR